MDICLQCGEEIEIASSSLVDISLQVQLGKRIKKCHCSQSCEGVRGLNSFQQSANCPTGSKYVVGPGCKPLSLIFKKTFNRHINSKQVRPNIHVADSKNIDSNASRTLHLEELSTDSTFQVKNELDYSPVKVTTITQPYNKTYVLHNQTKDRPTVVGQHCSQFQTNIADNLTSRHSAESLIQTCIDGTKSRELRTELFIDTEPQSAKFPLTERERLPRQESLLCVEKKKHFSLSHPVTDYLLSVSSGSINISFIKLRTRRNLVTEKFYCATGVDLGVMELFSTSFWRSAKSPDKSLLGSTLKNRYSNNLVMASTPSLLDILTDNSAASLRTSLEFKCRDMIMKAISEPNPTMFLDVESEVAYSSQRRELEGQTSDIANHVKIETNSDGDDKSVVEDFSSKPLVTSAILEQSSHKDIPMSKIGCTVRQDATKVPPTPNNTIDNDDVPFEGVGKNVPGVSVHSNVKDVTEASLIVNPPLTNTTEYLVSSPLLETTEKSINFLSIAGISTIDHAHTLDIEVSDVHQEATSIMENHQNSPLVPAPSNLPTASTNMKALDFVGLHTLEIEMSEACAMLNVTSMSIPENCIHSPIDNKISPVTLCTLDSPTPEDLEGNLPTVELTKEHVILPTKGITSEVHMVLPTQDRPTAVGSISLLTQGMIEGPFSPTRGRHMTESYTNSPTKLTRENSSPRTGTSDAMAVGPEFLSTRLLTEVAISSPTKGIQEDSEFLLARDTTEVRLNLPNQPDNALQGPSFERKYLEHSPLLFSEEEEEEIDETSAESSLLDEIRNAEETRLHRLQKFVLVGGVLPPPSVTMPQLTASDILDLVRRNTPATVTADEPSPGRCRKMRLTCNSRLVQVKESVWPDVKQCCYPDIYYNNGSTSEEFEALCVKYKERYVGNETASSCNVWFTLASSSGQKRKRAGGPSPGRRLSHLASRRRQMFSKDNLFNISAANRELAAAERRKIHLDTKRTGQMHRSRSLLLEKGHERGAPIPSGSNAATKVGHKRALFQSPDESKKYVSSSKATVEYTSSDTGKNRSFKRALFCTSTEASGSHSNSKTNQHSAKHDAMSKKRHLVKHMPTTSQESPLCNSSKRKLMFVSDRLSGAPTSCTSKTELKENKVGTNHTTDHYTSSLDCNQRKKLMWAFSQALRSVGIGTMHTLFRPSVQALGRVCKAPILEAMHNLKGHASEVMLQVAMQHVTQVVEKKTSEFGANSTS